MTSVELLRTDLEELSQAGVTPLEAFARGLRELGERPTSVRPKELPGTEAGAAERVHLYLAATAELHMLRFEWAVRRDGFERSRGRYDLVERAMAELRVAVVPPMRATLRELRAREAALESELAERGIDPRDVGPLVPAETAADLETRPGERPSRRLEPLPLQTRRGRSRRLLATLRGALRHGTRYTSASL